MAQRHPTASQMVDTVESDINETIDRLISLLNVRRAELLNLVRQKRAVEISREENISDPTNVQKQFRSYFRFFKNKMLLKQEYTHWEKILNTPIKSRSELKCDTRELERRISRFGEIIEVPVNVPRYTTCHTSVVSTLKEGNAPGELNFPMVIYNRSSSSEKWPNVIQPPLKW